MRVAVAGGTGVVGRHVVEALAASGHDALSMARATGVDLVRGTGLDDAMAGVDAVVDVANLVAVRQKASAEFFRAVTRNLHAACARAGTTHYVVLSIVGIDTVHWSYYRAKQLQERLVLDGPVPATVLRATQFHEFPDQISSRLPGPLLVIPDLRVQPIAAREVGAHLAQLATGPAQGRVPDLAGPRQESLAAMARALTRARGRRRPVVPIRLRIGPLGAVARGGLLPTEDGPRGTQTFDDWISEHFGGGDG